MPTERILARTSGALPRLGVDHRPAAGDEPTDAVEADGPIPWYDVFFNECVALNPAFAEQWPALHPSRSSAAAIDPITRLSELDHAAFAEEHSALCLSGGGIRSASFAVGVIQGLARHGVIRHFDYLSTVSGGGFAGAWLTSWIHRTTPPAADAKEPDRAQHEAAHSAFEHLARGGRQAAVEPWPLTRLRQHTSYMSPQGGMFSADFWGLIATMLRNLVLNWMVLLPLVGAALLVPRVQYGVIHLIERELKPNPVSLTAFVGTTEFWTLVIANALYLLALAYIATDLPSYGNRQRSQREFVWWCLLPLGFGTLALTDFWALAQIRIALWHLVLPTAAAHAMVWIAVGLITGNRRIRPRTWIAAFLSGGFGALLVAFIAAVAFPNPGLGKIYVSTAFPLAMGAIILENMVFVGLAGGEINHADLEWWSRAGGWGLIVIACWLLVCGLVFGGPAAVAWLVATEPTAARVLEGVAVLVGVASAWLARPSGDQRQVSPLRRAAIALAAPTFVIMTLVAVASFDEWAVRRLATAGDQARFAASEQSWGICRAGQEVDFRKNRCHPADAGLLETLGLAGALCAFGFGMSRFVPANKFSLHGMYKHRIIRAFVGSSRRSRKPNPFTGFDPDDDIELHRLAGQRPMLIVNATLNTATAARPGRQERNAETFTFSPYVAGNTTLGYRPTTGYACDSWRQQAITLGSAITISGAAASPAMGEFTTPALGFLLTLFNARLGAWLGNPGPSGRTTWRHSDPKAGVGPIFTELLGLTTDVNPYVYLSDGGHFDNLGLWEMIDRHCKFIVVVDCGCDPQHTFADLANAIRQVRIDQGVRIDLEPMTWGESAEARHMHAVAGTIRYDDIHETGMLVYLKPLLTLDEPVDVLNYQKVHTAFPHESTTDQWFSEAQFESYRMLGLHSVETALADASETSLGAVVARISAAATRRSAML